MAFAAVGAILAGSQAVTAGLVLTAVAEVGMAVTVVGAVTGNQKMMKVGGIMSLVGGVGGLIANAASSASAAAAQAANQSSAAGWALDGGAAAGAGAGAATGSAANYGAGQVFQKAATDSVAGTIASGIAEAGAAGAGAAGAAGSGTAGIIQGAVQGANAAGDGFFGGLAQSTDQVTQAISSSAATSLTPMDAAAGSSSMKVGANVKDVTSIGEKVNKGSFFGKIGDWAEKNQSLAGAIIQVGGSAMAGMAEAKQNEELMELKKRELAIAEGEQYNRSNTVAPPSDVSRPPMSPYIQQQTQRGLIRGAM